jgi:UDP-N-acetylmuramyl pentapeptide phosphotransferase/UDP-N-acetylglucosamine-1-phosphate transferase
VTPSNVLTGAAIAFSVSAVLSFALARSTWSSWPRDVPNERSLHKAPTPRTGGLAILLGLVTALDATLGRPEGPALWICAATGVLALVSFVDDRKGLPVGVRLLAQVLAAAAAVWGAGLAAPRAWLPFLGDVAFGVLAAPLSFLGLLWLTNLYNFMDGMDGFAGSMTAIGGAFLGLALLRGGAAGAASPAFFLAAASAGFLLWNRPPARIFMGDVGAVPIGFLVGCLGLAGAATGAFDPAVPLLCFAPFVLDATATLFQRLLRGERVWQAHRSHYYQRLVLAGWTHGRTLRAETVLMALSGAAALAWQGAAGSGRAVLLASVAALFGVCAAGVRRVALRAL